MKHIVVGTAGHIDHGKSTLVQALTGIDPDRLKEEKERGITIELGFAHATLGDLTVAFVDVPGHERFVKTMLAGAGGIDCVMLIVAADESVMPQTREHFDICRLLKVEQGLVVLTKADLVDDETLELVRLEARELVEGSFLDPAPVVAVSARTGSGLDELRTALVAVHGRGQRRRTDGAARLPIDRAFIMQGFGTVVTGTLIAGRVRVDDELVLVPGETPVRVRGVQVHGKRSDEAVTGQRTAVNLGGLDAARITRGQSLATPGSLTLTRRVDATLDLLPTARVLKHGARVRFHQGTSETLGRVSIAGAGRGDIQPGTRAHVRIRLESPAALTRGDRFIIRAYSPTVTVGGGEVLDPEPPRAGARTAAGEQRFAALAQDENRAIVQMIADSQGHGLPVAALTSRAGVAPSRIEALVSSLEQAGGVRRVGDRLVATAVVGDLSGRLLSVVGEFHKSHPLADGVPREEARERVFAKAHPAVFEHVLAALAAGGKLSGRDRLALPGHRLELSPEEARARELIEKAYSRAGLKPPDAATLAAEGRMSPALVEKMTSLLLRQKVLARLDTLVFHVETLNALKSEVQALKTAAPDGRATVDVATFKDRYGVTRKFAIPLLEWLDRERVTRRMGDTRVIL
ncbi:MAG TPA: selenocysteine-specific translation elongation factor [Vicinamibacterales bacterium]|nr:selenocysteine-specific translation elongation factor [Vicinamibacterales bacterium]